MLFVKGTCPLLERALTENLTETIGLALVARSDDSVFKMLGLSRAFFPGLYIKMV